MRSIITGVSHLRSGSFIGPPSADACARCSRLRRRIRGALHLLACLSSLTDSDPKARSALRIKEEGKSIA
jgi:molybdenum cofactor biosynthesis enzyme MoaA